MKREISTPGNAGRRDFLKAAGLGMVALSTVPLEAHATPESVSASIKKLIGDKATKDGKINIILPEIAEDGGTVPLAVEVDSPMSDADHVKALHLFADGNPLPDLATYKMGPHNGRAKVSVRIRLGKTQNVVVVAEMSGGETFIARRKIKVTLGGCGG